MMDLYRDEEIVLIDTSQIIGVVRSALGKIDPRLVEHGERLGYIARKICLESADCSDIDLSRLLILCVLHDIGAYKTNEIDDMVMFETEAVFDHSLYGYLFIKNTEHLGSLAEAVLYHHTDYSSPLLRRCRCARYAELIHLADRADILLHTRSRNLSALRGLSGSKFNPEYVDAFYRAQEKYDIAGAIADGSFLDDVQSWVSDIGITSRQIMDYLKLIVYAIDFRSPYTVTHTADTTLISLELGRLLKLGERELQSLYIGSFLHDIGKIAIPHDILEKPGKLTPEEFEIIKRHIPEGEQILRGVVSDEICDIALRHHEKLDGSGYSRGLAAEELSFPQRIVAVADILSALSQRRSYKEPFAKDKVVSILTSMRDSGQLCARVVDAACGNYDMILGNAERSHDPLKTLYANLSREYGERRAEIHGVSAGMR